MEAQVASASTAGKSYQTIKPLEPLGKIIWYYIKTMHKNVKIPQTTHNQSSLEGAMFYGKSKKVIIIKDIHSNLFEEAILVLKEDTEQIKEDGGVLTAAKKTNVKSDFILKEAETVINNYIKDNKGKFHSPKKKELFKANSRFMKNLLINSALFGGIAAVVFLLLKLFL